MSLGLQFRATQKRSLFTLRKPDSFAQAVRTLSPELVFSIYPGDDGWAELVFCPRGSVHLQIRGDEMAGEVTTSSAGPGFHKAVVEFLVALQKRTGCHLAVEDETEYWTHRDWGRLEQEHRSWLRAVLTQVTRMDKTGFLICWGVGTPRPTAAGDVITPAGPFSHVFLKAEMERDQLADFGRRFWVWPNAERDACFRRGIALDLMWNEFAWVAPRNGGEERTLKQILSHLAAARAMAPSLPLPVAAWREALSLAGLDQAIAGGPDLAYEVPVGYRRGTMVTTFPGGWEVGLPGTFLEEAEEDGTRVWWEEGRNFRLSAYRLAPEAPQPLLPQLEPCMERITQESDGVSYCGCMRQDEEGWMLQGSITGPGRVAVVTMVWADSAHHEWARETFRSIRPPRQQP